MDRFDADVALVTRSTDELGDAFVAAFLREGVSRVYAAADVQQKCADRRVVPIVFDERDEHSTAELLSVANDITVVVNSLAPEPKAVPIAAIDDKAFTELLESNVFGVVRLARTFGPVLAANGGGAFVIVQSVQAWISVNGPYAASQAALRSITDSLRVELAHAGIRVVGVVLGLTMPDASGDPLHPQTDAHEVARMTLDAINRHEYEVVVDEYSRSVKSRLSQSIGVMYPELG
ncbi:NAD(P)-dependent dehydrogenase (short-subunit alcohol dehydrogenase family) [Mycetocola sp. CAN_C7]|uniref:SDR family NAD(P)-dependent oxidoreductase n=1 Tax=Mycetocola sp. CAN_C7 TaxID=2787724 RepID=UPI0018CB17CF